MQQQPEPARMSHLSEFDTYYGMTRLTADIHKAEIAWAKFQAAHGPGAVYGYLTALFEIRRQWQNSLLPGGAFVSRLGKESPKRLKREPFAALIFCTSDRVIVNKRKRSKWARALLYSLLNIDADKSLREFMNENDGINGCAKLYADTMGDWAYGPGW